MALARAVETHKKRGGAAVIVAHRHGAFAQCDTVYLMEGGRPVSATSGRGAAPVRSLQSAGGKPGDERLPVVARSPSAPRPRKTPAAVSGKAAVRPVASAPDEGRPRAASGPQRTAARPAVTIIRGGQRGESAHQAAASPSTAAREVKPEQANLEEKAGAGGRAMASARGRRIAAAIARVRGLRIPADGYGGPPTDPEPGGRGGISDSRTRRDDVS